MAAWTVMVYMAGDNNLSSAAEDDLAELRRVGSTDAVRVMVEVDRAGSAPSERRRIARNGVGETAIELVGMDACLMSNLEVAYEIRDAVRTIVASEETEPGGGWAYDRVLAAFGSDPKAATAAIATKLVNAYAAAHVAAGPRARITQS